MAVLKNVENRIKLVLIVSVLFLSGCVVISLGSILIARTMVADAHKKIYVLDGNVPILVRQTTMDETADVEARSHVEMFHFYFFTLTPDDKYINYTLRKALYLADESATAQRNTLNERGFYRDLIGTSTVSSVYCDSIKLDKSDKKSIKFTYYGRQRLERRTSVVMRKLITAGSLKRVPRSENNPHGFIIYNWRTLDNSPIEEKKKADY